MIDKKKLIRAMWDMYNNYYNDAVRFDEYTTYTAQKVLSDIQKMIEGLQPVGEWIPCSERLPEREENGAFPFSLVTLDNSEVCIGILMNDYGDWFARRKEGETVYDEHKVIAWMPLPEPYKENIEEEE